MILLIIFIRRENVKRNKGKLAFTDEIQFSSSKIINTNSTVFNNDQINYFKNAKIF